MVAILPFQKILFGYDGSRGENMQSIIDTFSTHGTLIQPDCLAYIMSKENPHHFSETIVAHLTDRPLILTVQIIKEIEEAFVNQQLAPETIIDSEYDQNDEKRQNLQNTLLEKKDQEYFPECTPIKDKPKPPIITSPVTWKPEAKEYDADVKLIYDITGNSLCQGTTEDFTKLFSDRFDTLRTQLRTQRRELAQVIPIKRVNKNKLNDTQLIGIVNSIRTTQNGHKLFELEDDTGIIPCIVINSNKDLFRTADYLLTDEIIGVTGSLSKNGDLFLVNNIIYPDISMHNRQHRSDAPLFTAFLSDIHIGSKEFMQKSWYSFLKWINGDVGNIRQKTVAGKIKYLVIPGDVVDGIGIYPNQENDLEITDLYKQYEELATQLTNIPDHVKIILQPGNHDAVRPAEPQPTFEKEIQHLFSANDITFISNPSTFSIHSVEILSYHGLSLLDYATNIQPLKFNEPIEIMKTMLQKHHLAPVYGGYTPLAPEHKDYMIIKKIPDIFVTGHVHLATLGEYRGVTLINASSWQSQTGYQRMMNFTPNPAKLPIADLQTGNVTMMDFTHSF
jgi:DNA polymerase II small subunit